MKPLNHPIVEESFAIIDKEICHHNFTPAEYRIARRVIHATADFEFAQLLQFSAGAIASGIAAVANQVPIVTDVSMVQQGIASMVNKTYGNPIISAVAQAEVATPGKTRTETGLEKCWQKYPQAIYVIGNAPTALLALCHLITKAKVKPALVIGVPVGFVSVIEAKQVLANTNVEQILVTGRKGGSPTASAIVNALLVLAWENYANRSS
ncbi:MAG: precorrin-8X methylmutase [Spirulinaceae cyanobacterium]